MPVENARYISELEGDSPPQSDPVSQGALHLQLIKTVLQTQFPNFTAGPCNATLAELNYLQGVTQNIQQKLNELDLRFAPQPLPVEARNFQYSPFWAAGNDTYMRVYRDNATFGAYQNVPWEWGSRAASEGLTNLEIGLIVVMYNNPSQRIFQHNVMRMSAQLGNPNQTRTAMYWRSGFTLTGIMQDNWARTTTAGIDDSEANGGIANSATAAQEMADIGCNINCPGMLPGGGDQ